MQRLLTRHIHVPRLEISVNDPSQEERLMRARDYVIRTAIPTVDDYILAPFAQALKDEVFAKAKREHGRNEHGILNDASDKRHEFEGIAITASAGPAISTPYEQVLDDMQSILRHAKGRKRRGREHVNASGLRANLLDVVDQNSTTYNRLETRLESAPELDVKELVVKLDKREYETPSQKTAQEYVGARSLRGNLVAFVNAVEKELQTKYAVPAQGAEINQELSDGSAVRYLFYPKTTTEHSEVFRGVVGQKTGKTSSSNGDLDILVACAFKGDYEHAQGKIRVHTDSSRGVGTTTITRTLKSGDDVRTYGVLKHNGVYVAIEDVKTTLDRLHESKSTTGLQLKVDFFPSYK